jgi:DNA-binding response OmpR family regulator
VSRRTGAEERRAMRKRTIVVVDDDQSILMILWEYLTQVGYEVLTANDVSSCLEIFNTRSKDIDLAILDIKIGRESGFELADTLEEKFRFHRYLFLTAFFWEEKTLEQLLQRGKPYFEKPLKLEKELLPFLKQYFGDEQRSS